MTQLIGEILLSRGTFDTQLLEKALSLAEVSSRPLGAVLISDFGISEIDVYKALAVQCALDFYATIASSDVSVSAVNELPPEVFAQYRFVPLFSDDQTYTVVIDDPFDFELIAVLQSTTGKSIRVGLTTPGALSAVRTEAQNSDSFFHQSALSITREYEQKNFADDSALSIEEIKKRTESEPVVKLVALIFDEALKRRASDIHIEPAEEVAAVRFRIDGLLAPFMEVTRWMFVPLTSRIKIMADLDIAEKRIPQDGRIRYSLGSTTYDFRVSLLPTHHGEKTVIRVLKHDAALLSLERIGLLDRERELIEQAIEKPQGMIFVTGPTGSGKSSTLFASLNKIRTKAINITTIEDPIEYKIQGINQVQINEKAGVTFAATLRSILRQDPDVILVGEIRDRETAEIAMQASQTGHLVFSTLHTNDAVSAITRLRDLGIPSFLIASSLLAIVAQRLVRVLCPACKKRGSMTQELKTRWKLVFGDTIPDLVYSAVGCDACNGIGYKGRSGIFEIVSVTDVLRMQINENASEANLRKSCVEHGMLSLVQNGMQKVFDGTTTPEEVLRVVMIDDMGKAL